MMTYDIERYPYFIYPAVMQLRAGSLPLEEEERLRAIVAANVGDQAALRLMLGYDPDEFGAFYPDMGVPELSTDDTIDTFLDNFGRHDLPTPAAAAEIAAPAPPPTPAELIKNHDYQGALEIIQGLILNNPEKSIYFADQIRFLKKLIVNEARKNQQ